MHAFVTVTETGSFSAASRRLNVGQPAISKTIAALEAHLGVTLLVRTTRSQNLTEAGRRFYQRARVVLDEADAAEADARDRDAALRGQLRISAPPVYASQQIIPRLDQFLADHPGLDIELELADRHVDLIKQGVDLAIRSGDLEDSGLIARQIDRSQRRLVAAPGYLEHRGHPRSFSELEDHSIVSYTLFRTARPWQFRRGSETREFRTQSRLKVDSAEALRAALIAGLGIGLVSERMVERELAEGDLIELLPDWSSGVTPIWAIYPAGRRPPERARRFVDWFIASIDGAAKAPESH